MMKNPLAKPKLVKIVINVGLKEALSDKKVLDNVSSQLGQITGQKAIVTHAKKAIAAFKLRQGDPIGLKVTLRGKRMWDFLTKLIGVVLPRVRDFRGIPPKSFDGRGNLAMGVKEQIIFPEINFDKVSKVNGMNLTFCTDAKTDEEGRELLRLLGMPFRT